MNQSKPFEILAARFQISAESAKYFLNRVQKSFQTEKPPHQVIVEFMSAQSFDRLPKPYEIAKLLNEAGVWAHPLNAEPPTPMQEEDLYAD